MESIGVNRGTVYSLRKELQAKDWAAIAGDNVTNLFGFDSLKNQTSGTANKEVTTYSNAESVNTQADESEKSDSLKNQTTFIDGAKLIGASAPSLKNQTNHNANTEVTGNSLKNQTCFPVNESEKSDKKSEKSDSHIRKNQQIEPAKEEEENMSGARAPGVVVSAGLVREVFAYWQYRLNHQQAKLTPEREKKIRARLKQGYTVAQIKRAIDGCASSPFHQGANESGAVYSDLTLICRDGGKLESFIARADKGAARFSPAAQQTIAAGERILAELKAKGVEFDDD
jgi:hypothetical protein